MTDLETQLQALVDRVPERPAPLGELLADGRVAVRRHRRTAVLAAVVAVVIVVGGGVGVRLAAEGSAPVEGVASRPTPPERVVEHPLQAPPGMRLVGRGRAAVAVPADWPAVKLPCDGGARYVAFVDSRDCPDRTDGSSLGVVIGSVLPGLTDGWAERTMDGQPVYTSPVTCTDDETCRMSVAAPTTDALFEVRAEGIVGAREAVTAVADSVRLLPRGYTTRLYPPDSVGFLYVPGDAYPVSGEVVRMRKASGVLLGQVVEVGGPAPGGPRPVVGGYVTVERPSLGGSLPFDANGSWAFYPKPGTYLVVWRQDHDDGSERTCRPPAPVTIAAGETEVMHIVCQVE